LKANTTNNWSFFFSNFGGYTWVAFGGPDWSRLRWSTAADTNCNILNVNYNGSGATTDGNFKMVFNGFERTLTTASAYGPNTSAAGIGAERDNFWNNADFYQIALINSSASDSLRKRLNHAAAFSFKIACN
jgi:hypothetical protein